MLSKIQDIITDIVFVEAEDIIPEASLRNDLDMSSLDLINMAVDLEKEFNIKITNKAIVSAQTVSDIMELITALQSESMASV